MLLVTFKFIIFYYLTTSNIVAASADWVQVGGDIDGEAAGDQSGGSVSLSEDGSRVAIGAPSNDGGGSDSGHVRVYDYDSSTWVQVGGDIDGEAASDNSGMSVSLSHDGSRVAIGALDNDGGGSGSGHVRVYDYDSSTWVQVGGDIDGEAADDRSGYIVSLSSDGSRVAVGAFRNDGGGSDSGHVRVYDYDSSAWIQIGGDIDGEAAGDESGRSVSLSSDGSRVAIGAPGNDGSGTNAGHVRVYEFDSSTWIQVGGDIDGEAAGDESGLSVSLSGDGSRVAIGAHLNDGGGSDSGHVRVYDFDSSTWVQVGGDIDGEAAGDQSGDRKSISLSNDGSRVAIGGYLNDGGSTDAGHVRVYEYDTLSSSWIQLGTDIDGDIVDGKSGRLCISSDGRVVAVGAYNANTATGQVRIWQIAYPPSCQPSVEPSAGPSRVLSAKDWTQIGHDIDGEAAGDKSGYSVSLSGDGSRVAIGAFVNEGDGVGSGHVRVYDYDSSTWGQVGGDIDGEAAGDNSGRSVSLSSDGSRVAIGANANDGGGTNSGHVRVYQYDSSTWVQVGGDIDGETAGDYSGFTVSLSSVGSRVAVGAYLNDGGGTESGHVRVHEYDSSSWVQVGGDIDGEAAGDRSGLCVSLSSDGSRVAVGAPYNDGGGTDAGHVRVYQFDSSTWIQVGGDIDGEAAEDESGISVSMSGDGSRVAIGAQFNDGGGSDSGHVRVYDYDSSTWVQVGGDIDGEAAGDWSGRTKSISLSNDGSRVAIGAELNDGGGSDAGHVRVYEYDTLSSSWIQLGTDIDGNIVNGKSGRVSLSSDGRVVAVGAYDANAGTGQVRIWQIAHPPSGQPTSQPSGEPSAPPSGVPSHQPTSRDWTQLGQDIDGEAAGDYAGISVSLSGDGSRVAIGGNANDEGGSDAGHVRVYDYDSSTWVQLGEDIDGGAAGDNFGMSVSLSSDGSRVAIGAYLNDGGGTNSGHVRVYAYDSSTWVQVGGDIDGEATDDRSGLSVSLSNDGSRVAIGAYRNDGGGSDSGHVRVYVYDSSAWIQVGGDIDGEATDDSSGRSVSLSSDGSRVAIGAPYNDGGGIDAGHVRVYQFDSSAWIQVGGDIDGEAAADESGISVSLSGDGSRVAIGAQFNDGGGSDSGHVRVYDYDSSTWVQVGGDIDGEAAGDRSGRTKSIALSIGGSRVAIGADLNDGGGTDAGHVRVYEYDTLSSSWIQLGTDIDGNIVDGKSGRVSISSDGGVVAVGAYDANAATGQVRIWQIAHPPSGQPTCQPSGEPSTGPSGVPSYLPTARDWTQLGQDIDGEAAGDYAGISVSLSGDGSRVAIGAYTNDGGDTNSGHVRVYDYDSSNWVQVGGDIDGEAAEDRSGYAVSLSSDGSRVAIGAYKNDGGGSDSGHVRVYGYDSSTWVQVGGDIDGEAADDTSGFAVSLSSDGSRVAIGAYKNDGGGSDSGHVRVYDYDSSTWVQVGGDIDGEAADDRSGFAVSLSRDGSRVAIGTPYNDGGGTDAGHVRVYEFDSSAWIQVGGDIDGEAAGDESGMSVSMSGDGSRVAIGARLNDGGGSNSGHVRVYDFDSSTWVQVGGDIDGEATGDQSGDKKSISLSNDGSRVAIGAELNDGGGTDAGHVRVFEYDTLSSSWIQLGTDIDGDIVDGKSGRLCLSSDGRVVAVGAYNANAGTGQVRIWQIASQASGQPSCQPSGEPSAQPSGVPSLQPTTRDWTQLGQDIDGEAAGDSTGISVSLSGDGSRVAIGGNANDEGGSDAGHVRIYDYDSSTWVQVGEDIDGESAGDNSGISVSLSSDGNRVAIGAHLNDGGGTDSGHVRVYDYDSSTWVQVGGDIDGEAAGDYSGYKLSLSSDGSRVAIGAYLNNGGGTNSGHVRVYEYDSSAWVQVGGDIDGEAADDRCGFSVSLSSDGSRVAIGAPYNDGGGSTAGHVRVYEFDSSTWVQVGGDIDGEAAADQSGISVSLSGDGSRVAIGARYNDGGGSDSGHVRVYDYDTSSWVQVGGDIDGEAAGDLSGHRKTLSLSNDGSRVAIGAELNDGGGTDAGHVRVYEYDTLSSSWIQLGTDIDGDVVDGKSGRVSISSDGRIVAVGAYNVNAASGQVRIWQIAHPPSGQPSCQPSGEPSAQASGVPSGLPTTRYWTQLGQDIDGEAAGDYAGISVSLSGDGSRVAIGANANDEGGSDAGHVRVYDYDSSTWVQVGEDIDGEAAGDNSGISVSLSSDGSRVAIGAYFNDGGGIDSGYVRVYDYDSSTWVQVGGDIDGESADDNSGVSVSLSTDGSHVAIGAFRNDGGGSDSGHVRVYFYDSSAWIQVGGDIDGEAAGDSSGRSVSLANDGSRVAIGANTNDGRGTNGGHVRVYEFDSSTWIQVGGDIDGEAAGDESGISVSLSGNGSRVAIGARYNDGGGSDSGHVRVYDYDTSSWVQVGGDIDGEAAGDLSGHRKTLSLSNDGSRVAIGAELNDGGGTDAGHVRVFEYDTLSSSWIQLGTDIDGDIVDGKSGRVSISSDGRVVAVGAYDVNAGTGQVRIWQIAHSPSGQPSCQPSGEPSAQPSGVPSHQPMARDWTQLGQDIDGEAAGDYAGVSVSLSGDGSRVAIGANANDEGGSDAGHVRVYDYDSSTWVQVGEDIDGESAGDNSGVSVSLSSDGSRVAIGAYLDDGGGTDSGHVRVYDYDLSTWVQVGGDIDGEAADDRSGLSVSMSNDGSRVAIGAYRNDGEGTNSGHVRVYDYDSSVWVQVGGDIDGEAAGDASGRSVSLSSDGIRVAIGAYTNGGGGTDAGHVRVFEFDSSTWIQVGGDIDGEAAADESGMSVSMSGNGSRVAIGARFNDGGGSDSGHVRVYIYDSSSWVQVGGDIDGEATGDWSGSTKTLSLSNDGSRVAIGAELNDGGGTDAGHVRVYEYDTLSSSWIQMGTDIDGDIVDGRSGRVSMSSDGRVVAVGAYNANAGTGQVRIWQIASLASGQPSCQPSGEPSSQPSGLPSHQPTARDWTQLGQDIDGEAAGDKCGNTVSLSGDGSRVVIAASSNDGGGSGSGHVRVYDYDSSTWVQVGEDIDGEAASDNSGISVSLSSDGSRVAIGANANDGAGSNSGHVRVYDYDSSTWVQVGGDIDGEAAGDYSGYAVSMSSDGSRVAVGAFLNDGGGSDSGHVRVYDYDSSAWIQIGGDIDGEAAGDESGRSVSLSSDGSRVAIGAPYNDGGGSDAGHVRVYEFDSSTWIQVGGDIDGEAAGDESGMSVSLSGDGSRVAIGAPLNDGEGSNSGHVRVYDYDTSTWIQVGGDIDGEGAGDRSGDKKSISLSDDGSRVAIGAELNDGGGSDAGHVRVFEYDTLSSSWIQLGTDIDGDIVNGNSGRLSMSSDGRVVAVGADSVNAGSGQVRIWQISNLPSSQPSGKPSGEPSAQPTARDWTQLGQDIDGEAAGDYAGISVSLSGDGSRVAIGGNANDEGGSDAGHVRVYDYDSSTWVQVGEDIDGEAAGDNSGVSVSLSSDGSRVAIGAYFNDGGGTDSGHVRVYDYGSSTWVQVGGDIDGEAAGDYSGFAVSLSSVGSRVAIGAYLNNGGGTNSGHVRVYDYDSSVWVQVGGDIDGEAADDRSGRSVSLSSAGSRVAIGANTNDGSGTNTGHVRVYEFDSSTWVQVGGDIDGEATADESGMSVSMSGNGSRVAIGARYNAGAGSRSGHVRVYDYDSSTWVQVGGDIDGEAAGDESGSWKSISLSNDGSRVAIGAYLNDGGGTDAGHVRVYEYDTLSSSWIQLGTDIDGDIVDGKSGRVSMSSDGRVVAVGAYDVNAGTGQVRIWQIAPLPSGQPSCQPSGEPTAQPSGVPSHQPTARDWTQLGQDVDGEAAGDNTGISLSLSGDGSRVAIGGNANDEGGSDAGHVRVYDYDSSTWVQVGEDIDGEAAGDNSGVSVSLSSDGNRVAIGAHLNDGGGTDSGHVRVYDYDSSTWVQVGGDIDGEAAGDYSGYAVSLSSDGSRVAVGAFLNDGEGSDSGHVRVYDYDSSAWVQVGGNIDGEAAGDASGRSVSLSSDGSRVAIGANTNDGGGTDAGHVRVFEFDSSTWIQVGGDIDGEAAGDESGMSVSMSGDGSRLAIGAHFNDGGGSDSGHVRVYDYDTSTWVQVGGDIDGEAAGDLSGHRKTLSLSNDGCRVAIGAELNDGGGTDAGHVRVYEYDTLSSSWIQLGADIDGDIVDGKSGRVSVSSDGRVVAVGAYDANSGTGQVRIWHIAQPPSGQPSGVPSDHPTARDWTQLGQDIDGEGAGDSTGISVSLSGDGSRVAIGGNANDEGGSAAGHVRVYDYDSSTWVQVGEDIDGEAAGDNSGMSVSLSSDGSRVAIGAHNNDGGGSGSGHVRVYDYDSSTWIQVGGDIDGEAAGDYSGYTVSLSNVGSRVAIGAFLNDGGGTNSGHVRVYEFDSSSWIQIGGDIDGEAAVDSSGRCVSLSSDGSRVAIGAPNNDGGGTDAGHVRVYEFDSSTWVQVGGDIDGEAAADQSGISVSMCGDGSRVAIGAQLNDGGGSDSGHVRVYDYDSSTWVQVGGDIDGEVAGDRSGSSKSISLSNDGSRVAIGAELNDGGGTNAGHVRVFEYDTLSSSWIQLGTDIDGDIVDGKSGRVSMSSDGRVVAVGAYDANAGTGQVRILQISSLPSGQASCQPSGEPSAQPSGEPTDQPTGRPSGEPTAQPSMQPTGHPSGEPSGQPRGVPSGQPTAQPSMQPTGRPSGEPSGQPSGVPSGQPTGEPTVQPSMQPTGQPSGVPSGQPTGEPTVQPSMQPTGQPIGEPSGQPSGEPSGQPSGDPSGQPTGDPTVQPSVQSTGQPSGEPSVQPTGEPSGWPSGDPSSQPSSEPTGHPSGDPSGQPSEEPTAQPSMQPTGHPSGEPSRQPTGEPTAQPSMQPTGQPSGEPSVPPTGEPSGWPSGDPSSQPSSEPTGHPSGDPSGQPSEEPTAPPSMQPTGHPSGEPSGQPTGEPTAQPSMQPTGQPSGEPSAQPSGEPSGWPSGDPSSQPSSEPTGHPSGDPSGQPSEEPTAPPSMQPTGHPSGEPSGQPTGEPTAQPSMQPTGQPSGEPSVQPTGEPSGWPSGDPSSQPSSEPTGHPSGDPSGQPSGEPTAPPSMQPTGHPSGEPSGQPTGEPTAQPSMQPTGQPSGDPSGQPSEEPTAQPSVQPTGQPSGDPSGQPSEEPTAQPSMQPTRHPSGEPSGQPSGVPSGQPTVEPTAQPSMQPTGRPIGEPSGQPSGEPSGQPTTQPSSYPSRQPSCCPSGIPSRWPSCDPSAQPTSRPNSVPSSSPSVRPSHVPVSSVPTIRGATNMPTFTPTPSPTVIPTIPLVDPPAINMCQISNDGSYISVIFDKSTNRATLKRSHRCVEFLTFDGAANALCVWKENSVLRVYPTGYEFSTTTDLVGIGDKILVKDGMLRANCPTTATVEECLKWLTSSNVQCVVTQPDSPLSPEIAISVPSVVSPCTTFILDLTASTGSGGRPWAEVTVNVSSVFVSNRSLISASRITDFYRDDYALSPPTPLTSDYMVENSSYAFTVRLCNYLQQCNSASVTVDVMKLNVIPIVTVAGSPSRRMKRSQTLSISTDAYVSYCNSSSRYSDMILHWEVSEKGVTIDHLSSTSRDPFKFMLPGLSLSAGHSYTVTIVVTDKLFGGQASASVFVEITPSDVVAVITGGASRIWSVDDGNITVDASNSYDPDAVSKDLSLLEYKWSCGQSQSRETLSYSFCTELLSPLRRSSSPQLTLDMSVANLNDLIGASIVISVEVVGSLNRTDNASVSYTIIQSNSPRISFAADPPQVIYTHRRLELMTLVEINIESVAEWSVNDQKLDLSTITVTSTFTEFAKPGRYMFNMAIREFQLVAGSLYDFSLSVRNTQGEGLYTTLTLSVHVVEVPHSGEFFVSPSHGTEFLDYFSFATSLWANDELPLTYLFGYFGSVEDDYTDIIALNGRGHSAFLSEQLLPAGQEAYNYTLACGVYVFNNLNAMGHINQSVQVIKAPIPEDELTAAIMTQLLHASSRQDTVKLKSVISVGISVLNGANCSLAPISCESLGRYECGKTSHSCGECLPELLGQDGGDGNSPCYNVSEESSPSVISSNSSCDESFDCPDMQVCSRGRCVFRSKSCPSSCSDRGKCRFELISTGVELQQCLISDFTCRARCECDDGYLGAGCTVSQSAVAARQDARLQLILSLNETLQYEDVSEDSMTSIIRRVVNAGSVSTELVESSCLVLQSIITSVLELIDGATELSAINAAGLFDVLDNCDDVYDRVSHSSDVQGVSRKLSAKQIRALENNNNLREFLSIFTAESMVAGESTKNFIQSHSRSSMSKNAANAAFEQNVPRTQLESLFGFPVSKVQLEESHSGDETLTRSVILAENNVVNASLSSNSISVRQLLSSSDTSTLSEVSDSHVLITLQNKSPQKYVTLNESANATLFITQCSLSNRSQSINYTCPNGEIVSHVCNGANEVISTECPNQLYLPACVVLSSVGPKPSCDLVSFTPTNVTCNCTVTLHPPSIERKVGNVGRSRSAQSLGYIEIATMSQHTFEGVISTNREVVDLSPRDILNGLTIIVMFSIFWGCGVLGLFELIRNSWFSCHREVKPRERKRQSTLSEGVSLEAKQGYLLRYAIATSHSRLVDCC